MDERWLWRLGVLLGCFVLGLATWASESPLYDIPRLDAVTIDGQAADWGKAGFRVEVMRHEGVPATLDTINGALRLAWDARGLLLLATVHDTALQPGDVRSWTDCLGIDVAPKQGGDSYYFCLIAPGLPPYAVPPQVALLDRRVPKGMPELRATTAAAPIPGGYRLEVLLPWENLDFTPTVGAELACCAYLYDSDPQGGNRYLAWAWRQFSSNIAPTAPFHRLRLAAKAAAPVLIGASVAYPSLQRTEVYLVATAAYAGKRATITDARGKTLGRVTLQANGTGATATVTLPMPPFGTSYGELSVRIDRHARVIVPMPDADIPRWDTLLDLPVRPTRYVFTGETFPTCDFEQPAQAKALVSPYRLTTTYYDREYHTVTKATTPGRYGAVVEVTDAGERIQRYFFTLYRQADAVNWGTVTFPQFSDIPVGLGIAPKVAVQQGDAISEQIKWAFADGLSTSREGAILLAGLHDEGVTPATLAGAWNVGRIDYAWWSGLKRSLGLPSGYRYLVDLPLGYADKPQTRFPLLLVLHGSGQRGFDLEQVRRYGPFGYMAAHPEQPCILVAPQCPPNEGWQSLAVLALLDEVLAKYRVDPDRVYLTGLSMGGYGTWYTAAAAPECFAAIVPICGGGDPTAAFRMRALPTWAFHGAKDAVVPISESQQMVDALTALGAPVRFTIDPNGGHNVWDDAYNNPELYTWLFSQRRKHE